MKNYILLLQKIASEFYRRFLAWCRSYDAALSMLAVCVLGTFAVTLLYQFTVAPPPVFMQGQVISIKKGMTLHDAAHTLERAGIIRSAIAFESIVLVVAGEGGVVFGDYFFEKPPSMFEVARRITRGTYNLAPVQISVPDGATIAEIAQLMAEHFPSFKEDEFVELAKNDEGYLFPDTYVFLPTADAHDIYAAMRADFDKHIHMVESDIIRQGKTVDDIVIMASIIEREARTPNSRRIVSGILWKRLSLGMALQVDAPFHYISNKNSFTLTLRDLKADSPYNTYKNPGLPIGPIANPGLDSILAAIYPKDSSYLFYLSDLSGNMHYSLTYAEHNRKARYYLP